MVGIYDAHLMDPRRIKPGAYCGGRVLMTAKTAQLIRAKSKIKAELKRRREEK